MADEIIEEPVVEIVSRTDDPSTDDAKAIVEIAKVEAERDIKIAEIAATVETEKVGAIEKAAEASESEDEELDEEAVEGIAECLTKLEALETKLDRLEKSLLSPPEKSETMQSQPTTVEESESVVATPVLPEAEKAPPQEPPAPKRKKYRLI